MPDGIGDTAAGGRLSEVSSVVFFCGTVCGTVCDIVCDKEGVT